MKPWHESPIFSPVGPALFLLIIRGLAVWVAVYPAAKWPSRSEPSLPLICGTRNATHTCPPIHRCVPQSVQTHRWPTSFSSFGMCFSWHFYAIWLQQRFWPVSVTKLLKCHRVLQSPDVGFAGKAWCFAWSLHSFSHKHVPSFQNASHSAER